MKKFIISLVVSVLLLICGIVLLVLSNDKLNLTYPSGFLVALGTVILVLSIADYLKAKKKIESTYYDERQIKARGDAYRISFLTLMISLMLDGVIRNVSGYEWAPFYEAIMVHIFISLGVFINYSIFKDAYLEMNSNGKKFSIIFLLAGIFTLVASIVKMCNNSFIEDGKLTIGFLSLVCSIFCFSIVISFIVKIQIDKKKENEEEEEYYEES